MMNLVLPEFLIETNYEDSKLDYKWNSNIEDKITTVAPTKIADAVVKLNHKAMMGMATVLAELVFWRLHRFCEKEAQDLTDYTDFIEAAWAGIINKNYLAVEISPLEYSDNKAQVVLYNVDALLRPIANRYVKGSYFMQQFIAHLAAIVRHISPNKELFDAWLIEHLDKSAELFPAQYNARKLILKRATYQNEVFDSSAEPPIPREFYFSSNFDYQTADIAALNQAYLDRLDYESNPYLNSPETMLKNGFTGTPYKV